MSGFFKTIVQFRDGDTTISVDWLGGDDHRVTYTQDGSEFKSVECASLGQAFAEVYRFAAEDYVIADESCKVNVEIIYNAAG